MQRFIDSSILHLKSLVRLGVAMAAVLSLSAGWMPAAAQTPGFPTKPVTLIVPFGPASANDMLARLVGTGLAKNLGQSVVVVNRPGAGGAIGTAAIAQAAPDGYSIGMGGSATLGVNPNLYRNLPYDTRTDFTPLIRIGTTPNVLVVSGDSKTRDMQALIERLKHERLRYNSLGNGTTQHLAGAMLVDQLGAQADHVPYKNTGEALTALMAGEVDFGFYALPAVMELIKSGKLRALGVTTREPIAQLADTPPLTMAPLRDFERTSPWFGVVGPKGMSEAVASALNYSLAAAIADPALNERLSSAGYILASKNSIADFKEFLLDQLAFWAALVQKTQIRID